MFSSFRHSLSPLLLKVKIGLSTVIIHQKLILSKTPAIPKEKINE